MNSGLAKEGIPTNHGFKKGGILKDRLSRIYRSLEERLTATENTRAHDLAEIARVA